MKLGLLGVVTATVLAAGAGTASAQPIVVPAPYAGPAYVAPSYPVYSPGVVVGGTIATPGLSIGGVYAPGGYGVVTGYRYGGLYGGYYGGYRGYGWPYYPYHHHHGRW